MSDQDIVQHLRDAAAADQARAIQEFADAAALQAEIDAAAPPASTPVAAPTVATPTGTFPAKMMRLGGEGDAAVMVPAIGTVYWGGNVSQAYAFNGVSYPRGDYFVSRAVVAGQMIVPSNATFGDPVPGLVKSLYFAPSDVAVPPTPGPITDPTRPVDGPAPAPAAPAPVVVTPAPAPVASSPSPTITPASLQTLMAEHYGYDASHVADATLAALAATDAAEGPSGEMTTDEGGTGARPEIGDVSLASQIMLCTADPRAEVHLLNQAGLSKKFFPYHVRVQGQSDDGPPRPWHLDIDKYGNLLYQGNGIALAADANAQYGIHYDPAHSPSFLTVPAIVVGLRGNEAKFREYLTEQMWRVAFAILQVPGNYQQGGKCLINTRMGQVREHAWTLRDRDDLLLLLELMPKFGFLQTSDDQQWQSWLAQNLFDVADYLNRVFNPDAASYATDVPQNSPGSFEPYGGFPTDSMKNPLGIIVWGNTDGYGKGSDNDTVINAPWQLGFLAATIIRVALRKHASFPSPTQALWQQFALYVARWPVAVFGDPNNSAALDIRFADRYTFNIGKYSTGKIVQTIADFRAANDEGRAATDPTLMLAHDSTNPLSLPASFANDVTPALAFAVDLGSPGAATAWARFMTMQQYAQGGDLAFAQTPIGATWAQTVSAPVATPAPAVPIPAPAPVAPPTAPVAGHVPVIPAYGQFASYPKVVGAVPEDVRPPMFAPGKSNDIGDDYNASAPLIPGTTKIARLSSGHNSPNFSPMGLFDYAAGTYSFVNQPTSAHAEAPPNLPSLLYADGSVYTGHMYSGLIATPASWSRQGILQCFVGGSSYPNDIYIRDPNSVMGGVTQFNTNGPVTFYNNVSAGAYSKAAKSETKGLVFFLDEFNYGANGTVPTMNSDGVVTSITSYTIPFGLYEGGIMLVDDRHELLLGVAAQGQGASTMTVGVVDLNSKVTTNSQVAGGSINIVGRGAFPEFASLVWSNERDCAFGVYCADAANPTTSMKFGYLLPPATGDRRTGTWTWTEYALTHSPFDTEGDPGLVPPTSPASNYVACTWIGPDDVLLLFSNPSHRPQIIRPPKEARGPASTMPL